MTMATIAKNTQPSFYYMLMAHTCVQRSRAAKSAHSQALKEAARDYLAKARSSSAHDAPRDAT
jgi:hypothetical protein